MKKWACVLAALILCLSLAGCEEIGGMARDDRKFMVSAIGFDQEKGKIKTSVELIVINSENYDSAAETRVISSVGRNIEETLDKIASSLTKPMLLNHCGIIAIGRSIDGKRFSQICDYAFYDERITLSAYMITAEDCEKLLTGKPEASVAVGYDMMGIIEQESAQSGVAYNSRYFEVEEQREDQTESFSLPHFVRKEERIFIDGMTVFHKDDQVKRLTVEQSALYALITGELRTGTVSIGAGDYQVKKRKLDWGKNSVSLTLELTKGDGEKLAGMVVDFKEQMERESGMDFFGFCALLNRRNPGKDKKETEYRQIDFSVRCHKVEEKHEGKNGV